MSEEPSFSPSDNYFNEYENLELTANRLAVRALKTLKKTEGSDFTKRLEEQGINDNTLFDALDVAGLDLIEATRQKIFQEFGHPMEWDNTTIIEEAFRDKSREEKNPILEDVRRALQEILY